MSESIFPPRSRVSRSHNASAKRTDSLYSFMEEHPADQIPETQTDDNEKKKKLFFCCVGGAREALQPETGLALSAPRGQTLSGSVQAPTPTCITCPIHSCRLRCIYPLLTSCVSLGGPGPMHSFSEWERNSYRPDIQPNL